MKILLLEDDYLYKITIKDFLEEFNYEVDDFENGKEALNAIYDNHYSLLLLDIRVPDIDGYEILKDIRENNINTPVIILTSLTDINNLSLGYELGCSDYLKKPFELKELKYRIDYIIKTHCFKSNDEIINIDDNYSFNIKNQQLIKNNELIDLSNTELKLVSYLIQNLGIYISIDGLLTNVWEDKDITYADIRMCVNRIRQKSHKEFILNKKMVGYKIGK
jgi:DNA-binding response OmpR family regulator